MDNSVDLQILLETGGKAPSAQVVSKQIQQEEKLKAILESAYEHALRRGIESEMKIIRTIISKNERNLDSIYNFGPLMIHERIVPPVITEARNVVQNSRYDNFKTTSAVYKIENQAYFSTTTPNWRSYLTFPKNDYKTDYADQPTKDLMPKGSKQREEWEKQTVKGFRDGQTQAQNIFKYALNKLNRDYTGMARFHEFVNAGKVTMPSIARTELAVINSGTAMAVDQKMLTIRTLPVFDGNMMNWNTWLEPVQYDPGKQAQTINDNE